MIIRDAKTSDAEAISRIISYYAELDRMLFCSVSEVYERLQLFQVAEEGCAVIGCCALQVVWSDLAEIKSLAVVKERTGTGVGRALVEAAIEKARQLGVRRVFTLTLEPGFFERVGFTRVDVDSLPMKVWSDCAKCPKQDNCDEKALVREL
ncbi:MAG TPA: N-acetyltransferase [Anaerohalosphaeraceae bacterium]|jgi:amino-acid N-acetyltransferase|nr:N-acetyltransferase [Anaerohalosphaeraceae bacterium]HRT51953.1 N-acetyltransferase [Anaerohalosphaeraceae bacterium]HRT88009.1 N-acetyltransferase [Anaerohalosphaeraceae bacterium]